MKKIAVVGDGAVGTAVAVALSSVHEILLAGPPGSEEIVATFTVAEQGSARLTRTGLDSLEGEFMVVAAMKAFHIRDAVPFLSLLAPDAIVCLSNGMGLEDEWGGLADSVEFAVLTSGLEITSGRTVSHSPGKLYCRSGGLADKLFRNTFFDVEPVDDIDRIRWAKWFANSIINPLGALTGQRNDRLRHSELGHFIPKLVDELAQLMPDRQSLIAGCRMLDWLLDFSSNRCSMLQDVEAGRRTEIDFLTGYAVKELRGRCPAAEELVEMVKART